MSFQFDIEAAKKSPKLTPEDSRELAARYKKDVERIDQIEGVASINKWKVIKNNILQSGRALILAELVPLAYTVFVFLLMDFHIFAVVMFGVALTVMTIIFLVYLGACVVNIHRDLSREYVDKSPYIPKDTSLYLSDDEWVKWAERDDED